MVQASARRRTDISRLAETEAAPPRHRILPGDIVKGASYNRERRFRIMALNDQLPTLTAYANDVGYECVFAEQLRNFAEPDDLLMAISGSGNLLNVVRAVEYANSIGCRTVALTGRDGGKLGPLAHINIQVPAPHGPHRNAHMVVCHMIGYYFMEQGRIS